jgi:glycine cleavage system H protein
MPDFLEITIDKFIFKVATDRFYSPDGLWLLDCGDGLMRLGLSDYVQQRSGDVAFVHPKPPGTQLVRGDEVAEIETIKANVSLVSPLDGEIVEVNKELELNPENVNQDPYGKGWLAVVRSAHWQTDRAHLLDPQAYFAVMQAQAAAEMESP